MGLVKHAISARKQHLAPMGNISLIANMAQQPYPEEADARVALCGIIASAVEDFPTAAFGRMPRYLFLRAELLRQFEAISRTKKAIIWIINQIYD